jgi:hypothetical protein
MAVFPRPPAGCLRFDRGGLVDTPMRIFLRIIIVTFVLAAAASAQSLAKIEDELLGHVNRLEQASNYGGSRNEDVQSKENHALRKSFLKYGNRSDVLTYSFPKLAEKMSITTSKDRNFRGYSWDTGTGGTMHDYITVFQYRGLSGKVRAWGTPYSDDISDYGVGAFVHDIFQLKSATENIYLVVFTFIGSTSLASQTISAFTIKGNKLNTKPRVIKTKSGLTDSISFEYDFFSVIDHPERPIKLFYFNEKERSFRFPVVIQDEKTPQGRVTDKFIKYRFDGKYFVVS